MPNTYNTVQTTITSTGSPTTVFTASSSTTIIKSVMVSHGSATSSATLGITKSGGSRTDFTTVSLAQDVASNLLVDVLPLASGDVLTVESTHQPTYVWVSYVENTTSLASQSIDVLTDVDTSTAPPTTGQVLAWDGGDWVPSSASSGSITSVNGDTGPTVSLSIADLDNVTGSTPSNGNVLNWQTNQWILDSRLTTLYTEFRNGTAVNVYADGATATQGRIELTSTGANLKTGVTGITVTETSPGDIEFNVATDASGNTDFTAIHLDGLTTANEANFIVKLGAFLTLEAPNNKLARFRYTGAANVLMNVPAANGTLALTSDIATDSAVVANTAKVGITAQQASDITTNNAKTGITSGQASAITANTAKVSNVQADWNASSGLAVILNKPTLTNGTVTSVTGTAPIASSGGATPAISISAATTSAAGSMSAADKTSLDSLTANYEEDELKTGQNTLINSSVSVASNKIVDVMGDALADVSNANSKKFLGFHTGSGVCVLQGMVDASNSISGATAGGALWIGTSGAFSATAPTTQNHYSRVVGHYIGTGQGGETLVYFNPSQDWIQID